MNLKATAIYRPRSSSGQFIAASVTPAVQNAVLAVAQLIVEEAQSICPVDTGALRDSITASVQVTDKTVSGIVTAAMFYAAYVEYGTGIRGAESPGAGPYPYNMAWPGMPAQPYMRPAIDTVRQVIADLLASQIAVGLSK